MQSNTTNKYVTTMLWVDTVDGKSDVVHYSYICNRTIHKQKIVRGKLKLVAKYFSSYRILLTIVFLMLGNISDTIYSVLECYDMCNSIKVIFW